jgi:hypothetical protein
MHDFAAAQASCEAGIIIGLTAGTEAAVAELARATGARIERTAAISPDSAAFTVRATGPDEVCVAVVDELRRDARVRFVERDARRTVRRGANQ